MTRDELYTLLSATLSTTAGELVSAWEQRVAEVTALLQDRSLAKPVKNKAVQELSALESAKPLIEQFKLLGKIEAYFADIATERAKPKPVKGVINLCLGKLRELIPNILDERERFEAQKSMLEAETAGKLTEPPLLIAPRLRDHPVSLTVKAGEGATISVVAAGSPPLSYQWRKGGANLAGATNSELKFVDATVADEGSYDVVVSNPAGEVTSAAARLKIEAKVEPKVEVRDEPPVEKKIEEKKTTPPPPPPPPKKPLPGLFLQLSPKVPEGTLKKPGAPIHLVARPRFTLGRQRTVADFVTWFLPDTPENQVKTGLISKVHTTLFSKGALIWVQDGKILDDGKTQASANDTFIDGEKITAPVQLNFAKERRIKLGQAGYELTAQLLPAVAPEGPLSAAGSEPATMAATVVLSPRPYGCVRFVPVSSREVWAAVVWMFTEATIGASPQCAVRLEAADLPPVAVRFHHWQGGFWLEVPAGAKSVVTFDQRRLAAGDVVPLQAAHDVSLGELNYALRIS